MDLNPDPTFEKNLEPDPTLHKQPGHDETHRLLFSFDMKVV
mgnify:CR=1 FL=1